MKIHIEYGQACGMFFNGEKIQRSGTHGPGKIRRKEILSVGPYG